MDTKILLTLPEVADRLGVGRTFAFGLVQRGEIASCKLGRARRVPVQALLEYVERLTSEATEADAAR